MDFLQQVFLIVEKLMFMSIYLQIEWNCVNLQLYNRLTLRYE